jgi:large subunit ribosomal protein L28
MSKRKLLAQRVHVGHSTNKLARADRGLFGGTTKMFGNQISHSVRHSRRTWSPNVHSKRLWSDALNCRVRVKVTAGVLRTIDIKGGLDNYLLESKDKKIDSRFGFELKDAVKTARKQALKQQ